MKPYAAETEVPVEKSKMQIERLLVDYKATSFMSGANATHSVIAFEMAGRRVKFTLPMPLEEDFQSRRNPRLAHEQAVRTRWRALYLALRAKLEMAATGITTFEDEFLAHIIMPDGQTVGETVKPRIQAAYDSGEVQALLPPPRR